VCALALRFYNKRGTAEQWIKEGKQAVKMTRLSCHRFRSNQVRLALSLLAYNLGNLWRRPNVERHDVRMGAPSIVKWMRRQGHRPGACLEAAYPIAKRFSS
jgi:hypothetical protein